jgi:hypothetical protein
MLIHELCRRQLGNHCHLGTRDVGLAIRERWPDEAALLQFHCEEAVAQRSDSSRTDGGWASPPNHLDQIAAPSPKDKEMTVVGIKLQLG